MPRREYRTQTLPQAGWIAGPLSALLTTTLAHLVCGWVRRPVRQASKKAEDVAAEGRACYRLATAYINSKSQYDIAIKYLTQYVSRHTAHGPGLRMAERCLPGSCSGLAAGVGSEV